MPNWTSDPAPFVARHAEARIRTALSDTRIVAVVGPRQSGKTTLARRIADRDSRPFITLDDDQYRRFAQDDPAGFMRGQQAAVIDEIQRAPDLILALKRKLSKTPSRSAERMLPSSLGTPRSAWPSTNTATQMGHCRRNTRT